MNCQKGYWATLGYPHSPSRPLPALAVAAVCKELSVCEMVVAAQILAPPFSGPQASLGIGLPPSAWFFWRTETGIGRRLSPRVSEPGSQSVRTLTGPWMDEQRAPAPSFPAP